MTPSRLPTYFISHGGGPWPYMEDRRKTMRVLEESLTDIPRQIGVVPNLDRDGTRGKLDDLRRDATDEPVAAADGHETRGARSRGDEVAPVHAVGAGPWCLHRHFSVPSGMNAAAQSVGFLSS